MKDKLILFGLTFIICLFLCLVGKFFWPSQVTFDLWWMIGLSFGCGVGNVLISHKR